MRHRAEHLIDQETLNCIDRFQSLNGFSPSYSEIADCLGLKGKSSVHRRMQRLLKAGLITQEARSRAIVIVKQKRGK